MAKQPGDNAPHLHKDEARQGGGDRKVEFGLPVFGPIVAFIILAIAGLVIFL